MESCFGEIQRRISMAFNICLLYYVLFTFLVADGHPAKLHGSGPNFWGGVAIFVLLKGKVLCKLPIVQQMGKQNKTWRKRYTNNSRNWVWKEETSLCSFTIRRAAITLWGEGREYIKIDVFGTLSSFGKSLCLSAKSI